jgi:AAA ATPase domain
MPFKITLKNYRCFADDNPASFAFNGNFTSFVGANNAGKSSLLRFFYEFRPLFQALANRSSSPNFSHYVQGSSVVFGIQGVKDIEEVFYNGNERDIKIELYVWSDDHTSTVSSSEYLLVANVSRPSNTANIELYLDGMCGSSAPISENISGERLDSLAFNYRYKSSDGVLFPWRGKLGPLRAKSRYSNVFAVSMHHCPYAFISNAH